MKLYVYVVKYFPLPVSEITQGKKSGPQMRTFAAPNVPELLRGFTHPESIVSIERKGSIELQANGLYEVEDLVEGKNPTSIAPKYYGGTKIMPNPMEGDSPGLG